MKLALTKCSICGCSMSCGVYKPKLYCSDNCRNYAKFKNALEKSILLMRPCGDASRVIRGDMFRLANSVVNGTNTISDDD